MKKDLGPLLSLYPMPTVLVGTIVNDKPNFLTVTHVGIMTMDLISVSLSKIHFSNQGIKANNTFSINIPSVDQVEKTDYVGTVSGKKVDKSQFFEIFYGDLANAPLIAECPVNIECKVDRMLDFHHHEVFVGKIIKTWVEETVLTAGKVDMSKVRPILFDMTGKQYWNLGKACGSCWSIGKKYASESG